MIELGDKNDLPAQRKLQDIKAVLAKSIAQADSGDLYDVEDVFLMVVDDYESTIRRGR